MLVLTRRENDKILIGDDIVIEVRRINRSSVSLGITAPTGVVIKREELAAGWDPDIAPGRDHKPKGKRECDK